MILWDFIENEFSSKDKDKFLKLSDSDYDNLETKFNDFIQELKDTIEE